MKIIRPIILLIIYAATFLGVSLFIKLGDQILSPAKRFQNPVFWIGLVPTALLLLGYTYLITWIYYLMVPQNEFLRTRKIYLLGRFLAVVFVIVSLIHILILRYTFYLVDIQRGIISYLKSDYIFFTIPLVLYSYLVCFSPWWRAYNVQPKHGKDDSDWGDI